MNGIRYLGQRMGCRRLSYYETKKTPLRVVGDEPEKVVVIAYRIALNDGKVMQGWMLPDPAMQFSNPYLGIGNNPVNYVDPDGEFAVLAGLIIKKTVVAVKAAKAAKLAAGAAKLAKTAKMAQGVATAAQQTTWWAKNAYWMKSGAINTLSNLDVSEEGFGWHMLQDFAAGAFGAKLGVVANNKILGMAGGGTLNAFFNAESEDGFYELGQNFVGGALSVYAGAGKKLKAKNTLFEKSEGANSIFKRQKSNIFAKTFHKNGDAFFKYGFQATAYDFAYSSRDDFEGRKWGHLGIFATGATMGAVADKFFLAKVNNMNNFWRSAIGAGSYSAEWFISSRIKKLPKNGFKWGGSSRNKSWILGGKWIEGTIGIFGE